MSQPARVVFDTDVLVGGSAHGVGTWQRYPTIPPISPSPYADCLGIIADPLIEDWALWTSTQILEFVAMDLIGKHHWDESFADLYVTRLVDIATSSGGGVIAGRAAPGAQAPARIRHVWGAALAVHAEVVVSDHTNVRRHSPGPPNKGGRPPHGTFGFTAREFSRQVDRARRGSAP